MKHPLILQFVCKQIAFVFSTKYSKRNTGLKKMRNFLQINFLVARSVYALQMVMVVTIVMDSNDSNDPSDSKTFLIIQIFFWIFRN